MHVSFLIKIVYLKGRFREIFYPLFHFLNPRNCQAGPGLKPGDRLPCRWVQQPGDQNAVPVPSPV